MKDSSFPPPCSVDARTSFCKLPDRRLPHYGAYRTVLGGAATSASAISPIARPSTLSLLSPLRSRGGACQKTLRSGLCWNGFGARRREMEANEPFTRDAVAADFR